MEKKKLKKVLDKIMEYGLIDTFKTVENFKKWVNELNTVQLNNFLNLDIKLENDFPLKHLLINKNLLSCKDYKEKLIEISKLKNIEGCVHLVENLCRPEFLNSKNFSSDIEKLSQAKTARYGLWVLGEETFINSPYHDEDLDYLISAKDSKKEKPNDFVVCDAIASVIANKDSIESPYHKQDMELIVSSNSDCLQTSHSYPERGLNNLAINKVSLKDKYHLENMQILAKNPEAAEFLFILMTTPEIIKGKYYREEVEALSSAKSKLTARAIYYYIVNPEYKFTRDPYFYESINHDIVRASIYLNDSNTIIGQEDPSYLEHLKSINKVDDHFVMHYVSLLMNKEHLKSSYRKFDLDLLNKTTDINIYMDLYDTMIDEDFMESKHHEKDALLISKTTIDGVRDMLCDKARLKLSFENPDHEFDMNYISKLDLDYVKENIYDEMHYYLFTQEGLQAPNRKEKLEKLYEGIMVERYTPLEKYFDSLQKELENSNDDSEVIKSEPVAKKVKSKISNIFKKNKNSR